MEKNTHYSSFESFIAGFERVLAGDIKTELTSRQIAELYPRYNEISFYNGIIDAQHCDYFRYDLIRLLKKDISNFRGYHD